MSKIFVNIDGVVYGPYTARQLMKHDLLPDVAVKDEGMNAWVPASSLNLNDLAKRELAEELAAVQPKPQEPDQSPRSQWSCQPQQPQQSARPLIGVHEVKAEPEAASSRAEISEPASQAPQTVFPPEIEFKANLNKGFTSKGGKLIITPEQLIFRPHAVNIGNRDESVYEIKDITGYNRGVLTFMHIYFRNAQRVKFVVWDKGGVIEALELRRQAYFKSRGIEVPQLIKQ